jgi:hypothetical protein
MNEASHAGAIDIPRFTLQRKSDPLPAGYVLAIFIAVLLFELLPYVQELWRGWRPMSADWCRRRHGVHARGARTRSSLVAQALAQYLALRSGIPSRALLSSSTVAIRRRARSCLHISASQRSRVAPLPGCAPPWSSRNCDSSKLRPCRTSWSCELTASRFSLESRARRNADIWSIFMTSSSGPGRAAADCRAKPT